MAFNADDADASGDDPAWYVKVYRSTDMEFWNRNEHAPRARLGLPSLIG
jgi:hypothetical protein